MRIYKRDGRVHLELKELFPGDEMLFKFSVRAEHFRVLRLHMLEELRKARRLEE